MHGGDLGSTISPKVKKTKVIRIMKSCLFIVVIIYKRKGNRRCPCMILLTTFECSLTLFLMDRLSL